MDFRCFGFHDGEFSARLFSGFPLDNGIRSSGVGAFARTISLLHGARGILIKDFRLARRIQTSSLWNWLLWTTDVHF